MPIPQLQIAVVFATIFISIAVAILARRIMIKYMKNKARSFLFWGLGLWLFSVATLIEALFAVGIYSTFLIDAYLFIVIILVQFLSFGSIELVASRSYRKGYYAFSIVIAILALASIVLTNPGNLIENYVVAGELNIWVALTSALATTAASVVLVVVAGKTYLKTHNIKMLSIIAGVVVVAIAGSLYIAAVPELLYYAEFIGMVLLWHGFT